METGTANPTAQRLRLLVAIASYGEKNLHFLRSIIQTYRSMDLEVHVVVLSNAPKDLGKDVEVRVGLPTKNPWSLPFGHKPLFAQRLEQYDLFAYSEDDMEVTEPHVRAFVRATQALEPGEIAGFLRYERDASGRMTLPDVHGPFHWRLGSVHRRGSFTIAEFTNEHAAFFLLTQAQLRKAIASGGFLREPEDGRHDMLCEAATDPYTRCGFRKVICVSALDDFLIHHLPDRYAGRVGLPIEDFKAQIRTVIDIQAGTHPASVLCEVETKFSRRRWSKIYYKEPDKDFLDMVPAEAATALSVGCGWGALEEKLTQRGARVTALPLDSVIGAMAARFGIEMIYGTLQEGLDKVTGREFDCVLVTDLLHLQREPWEVLGNCARLVKPGGMMVVQSHNFNYLPVLVRRVLGLGEMRKLRSYSEGGVTPFGLGSVAGELKARGFRVLAAKWFNGPHFDNAPPPNHFGIRKYLGKLMAEDWVLRAQREPSTRTRTRQAEQTVR